MRLVGRLERVLGPSVNCTATPGTTRTSRKPAVIADLERHQRELLLGRHRRAATRRLASDARMAASE